MSALSALGRAWYKRRGLALDVLPAVFALALMFYLGLAPIQQLPGPEFELADKFWHFVAFGGLAGLLARAVGYFRGEARRGVVLAAWLSLAFGGLIEVLQGLTPFRSADPADFLADALGVALAYAVLHTLERAAPRSAE